MHKNKSLKQSKNLTPYEKAYNFVRQTFYRQFSKARYLKYQNQFPNKKQSEIIQKIGAQWDLIMLSDPDRDLRNIIKIGTQYIFAFYLNLSETSGPFFHVWRDIVDQDQEFNIQNFREHPLHQIHQIIQNVVGRRYKRAEPQFQYVVAFNYLKNNNQILNENNLIQQAQNMKKISKIDILSSQLKKEDQKLFFQLNKKTRLFRQKGFYQQHQKKYFQALQQDKKDLQIQKKNRMLQEKGIERYFEKEFIQQKILFLEEESSNQIEIIQKQQQKEQQKQVLQQKKKRKMKKKKKIIENFGRVGIYHTSLTYNKAKYHYCEQCFVIVRNDNKQHKCILKHDITLPKKKYEDKSWFFPFFSIPKKLYGLCALCKQIRIKCDHQNNCSIIFRNEPVQPIFLVGQKIFSKKIELIKGHMSRFYFKNDSASFYQPLNLGQLPNVIINKSKIRLFSYDVLSAFQEIPIKTIFGPIGIDVLPVQLLDILPWDIKHFSNKVNINQKFFIIAPLIRFNELGFLLSVQQAASQSNTQLFLAHYEGKCCVFGITFKLIQAGEQISFKSGFINVFKRISQKQNYHEQQNEMDIEKQVEFYNVSEEQGQMNEEQNDN